MKVISPRIPLCDHCQNRSGTVSGSLDRKIFMNVVLDVKIVLDLLLKRRMEYEAQSRCFSQLKKVGAQLWFPVCALPTLDYVRQLEIKRLFYVLTRSLEEHNQCIT